MGLEYFDKIERLKVDNFRNFSLRESMRKTYEESISYELFSKKIEKLISNYNDIILNYSIDIIDGLFIILDINKNNSEKIKIFYNDFLKLLKYNNYYVMKYVDEKYYEFNEELKLDVFINNNYLRIYLDKLFDIPIELKNVDYLYHVTTKETYNVDIKNNGIKTNKSYMVANDVCDKIYLFEDIKDCESFIDEKRIFLKSIFLDFVILKIDIKTMGIGTKIYKDRKETTRNGYYVKNNIPYWSIIEVK